MMKYWQLTKENGREMLDILNSYMKRGYIWHVTAYKVADEIRDFSIIFNCGHGVTTKDPTYQWYVDRYGEKFQIGDYLVEKNARLFITSTEGFKKLEEEEAREKEAQIKELFNKLNMNENEPDDCKDQIADQESLFDELFEACKNSDYARREYLQNELIYMGVSMEEIKEKINALYRAKSETKEVDIKTSSTLSIDELQKILVRRAQLQKELAEMQKELAEIEETLTKKYEIKVIDTENK